MGLNQNDQHSSEEVKKYQLSKDNDTYGHSSEPEHFSKKNEPEQDHILEANGEREINSSDKLKNINLTQNDAIESRNSNGEKGIGGKNL